MKKILNSLFPFDNNDEKFIYDDNIDLNKVQEQIEYIIKTFTYFLYQDLIFQKNSN